MIVLLTGATGFIGRNLLRCASEVCDDVDFVLLSSREIEGYRCILHKNYTYTTKDFINAGIKHIDAVIHLGAFSGKTPQESYSAEKNLTTITKTQYLIKHLPNNPRKFITCSSVDVYGGASDKEEYDPEYTEMTDETKLPTPMNNYAMAKLFAEEIIKEWATENNVCNYTFRLGNQYGIGDARHFFINVMAEKAAKGETLIYTGNPLMMRNYIYVRDTCRFILNGLTLSERDIGVINIVSSENHAMIDIVKMFSELSGTPFSIQTQKRYLGRNSIFSSAKREKYLGKEGYTLKKGMEEYYRYIESFVCLERRS